MPVRSCFVIMPIGDQQYGTEIISAKDLHSRYADLIKEAILKADPSLDVTRADEVAIPGAITNDILTRIMHSDLVIADITYPNPNVFYELGLRHACKPGTIIIRDRAGLKAPFDVAHLRHIEYDNTPSGLKKLTDDLRTYIFHLNQNPERPDNQLLELAKLTGYAFPNYKHELYDPENEQFEALISLLQYPDILELLVRSGSGEAIDQSELLQSMFKHPEAATTFMRTLFKSGNLSMSPVGTQKPKQIKKSSKR